METNMLAEEPNKNENDVLSSNTSVAGQDINIENNLLLHEKQTIGDMKNFEKNTKNNVTGEGDVNKISNKNLLDVANKELAENNVTCVNKADSEFDSNEVVGNNLENKDESNYFENERPHYTEISNKLIDNCLAKQQEIGTVMELRYVHKVIKDLSGSLSSLTDKLVQKPDTDAVMEEHEKDFEEIKPSEPSVTDGYHSEDKNLLNNETDIQSNISNQSNTNLIQDVNNIVTDSGLEILIENPDILETKGDLNLNIATIVSNKPLEKCLEIKTGVNELNMSNPAVTQTGNIKALESIQDTLNNLEKNVDQLTDVENETNLEIDTQNIGIVNINEKNNKPDDSLNLLIVDNVDVNNKIVTKESETVSNTVNEKENCPKESSTNKNFEGDLSLDASKNDTFVSDASFIDIHTEHGLNKPDAMIEIPLHDLSIESIDTSLPSTDKSDSSVEIISIETSLEMAVEIKVEQVCNTVEKNVKIIEHSENRLNNFDMEKDNLMEMVEDNNIKEISESSIPFKVTAEDNIPIFPINTSDTIVTIKQITEVKGLDEFDTQNIMESEVTEKITDEVEIQSIDVLDVDITDTEVKIIDSHIPPEVLDNNQMIPKETSISENVIIIPGSQLIEETKIIETNDFKIDHTNVPIVHLEEKKVQDEQPSPSEVESASVTEDPQPSTSAMEDLEIPETDSLGLLAESSRVMDDDDEQEDNDEDADDDEDDNGDDDYQDDVDESNQLTIENSEDSSTLPAEGQSPKHIEAEIQEDITGDGIELQIASVASANAGKDMDIETYIEEPKVDQSMDIETVKLSDTSDNEEDKTDDQSLLRNLLLNNEEQVQEHVSHEMEKSPSKTSSNKTKGGNVVNIVDLEESSSEDDLQEVSQVVTSPKSPKDEDQGDMTSVNLPTDIEIMCTSAGSTSEIVTLEGEVVISGVPKARTPYKTARLNTSEVTIKTTLITQESTLVIPETKMNNNTTDEKESPKQSVEVFSLDSDDEDSKAETEVPAPKQKKDKKKCVNFHCANTSDVYYQADSTILDYYDVMKKKKPIVCHPCADAVGKRMQSLVEGIMMMTPLLELDLKSLSQDLVEISDSDSEGEVEETIENNEQIGDAAAEMLKDKLADMLNETWLKYNMDERLMESEKILKADLEKLEKENDDINAILHECQVATDKLRVDLYKTFEGTVFETESLEIFDTPNIKTCSKTMDPGTKLETRSKRRLSSSSESPAKKPAIPLGYAPLEGGNEVEDIRKGDASRLDDDSGEISVVKLSAEAAPPELPPPGELRRAALRPGTSVYAMRNLFGSWVKARILHIEPNKEQGFTVCRVKFDHKIKNPCRTLSARCLAFPEPADVRMTIGTRIIALFKDDLNTIKRESFYSGIVAEVPNPVNNYRYLVFFDDGYAQYVQHADTRLVCEYSQRVWEEVQPFSREFVRDYIVAYPERPMVRLHAGQTINTEWNGKWWVSTVVKVDASLVQMYFEGDNRFEWIYRGSTRLEPLYLELQAAVRHRARPLPRSTNTHQPKKNMPYVEYTRSDSTKTDANEDIRRQRAVAKKSTTPAIHQPSAPVNADQVTSRVVYYTPKNAVKPYKMVSHTCSPKCKRKEVLALKDLRTYNPLAKPLLSGWERQITKYRGVRRVMYVSPCGRRVRDAPELHRLLRAVHADMGVELFDFNPNTHCLAEFVLNKCVVSKKDLSHGKENVPVPCVNYYDESLPEFCSYSTERTPTAGVPLNLDPDFLCGCDCADDCQDKSKCACWKMTLEGARTIGLDENVGYVYKRLPEPLPSGIYECNSRCKCKDTCLNRVAQHPLQLKLQVFKTQRRGWGIRALNDVPKGSFLCVYAGNLLTDATANLDGLNEGDEYLAELDYIEVVEQMKEGFEEDVPSADKKLDKNESDKKSESEESGTSSEEEEPTSVSERDDDFKPPPEEMGGGVLEFNKRLRKRDKKKEKQKEIDEKNEKEKEEDCITISDDEEVREPSRFMAAAGMGGNEYVPKYKSVRSHFGKDEACYIMDAKVQGNIGRYLNHSCTPNVFVQNVFVDTHDPRFPWVAFFALNNIRAGTELTWNYNYDIGSVPGKVLYCYCGAANCRGRLL